MLFSNYILFIFTVNQFYCFFMNNGNVILCNFLKIFLSLLRFQSEVVLLLANMHAILVYWKMDLL